MAIRKKALETRMLRAEAGSAARETCAPKTALRHRKRPMTSIRIRVLHPTARRTPSQNLLDIGLALILAIAIVAGLG